MNKTHGLFWFRHDLRLHDNPALLTLSEQVDAMTCVYLYPKPFSSSHVPDDLGDGQCQKLFRDQSLLALRYALQAIGSELLIVARDEKSEAKQIASLCEQLKIDVLGVTAYGGFYERESVTQIRTSVTNLNIVSEQSGTLFNEEDLPFEINDMPNVFTAFRKKVEKYADVSPPADTVTVLPPPLDTRCESLSLNPQEVTGISKGENLRASRILSIILARPELHPITKRPVTIWMAGFPLPSSRPGWQTVRCRPERFISTCAAMNRR